MNKNKCKRPEPRKERTNLSQVQKSSSSKNLAVPDDLYLELKISL